MLQMAICLSMEASFVRSHRADLAQISSRLLPMLPRTFRASMFLAKGPKGRSIHADAGAAEFRPPAALLNELRPRPAGDIEWARSRALVRRSPTSSAFAQPMAAAG